MFESLNINRYAKGLLRTHFKRLKEQTKNDTFNSAVQTQYLIMGIAMGWNSTNQITDEQEYFIRRLFILSLFKPLVYAQNTAILRGV